MHKIAVVFVWEGGRGREEHTHYWTTGKLQYIELKVKREEMVH